VNLFRFGSLPVPHAVSTRQGGLSDGPYASLNVGYGTDDAEERVTGNRLLLLQSLGIAPEAVIAGRLSHGNAVTVFRRGQESPEVERPVRAGSTHRDRAFLSDAAVSDVPGLYVFLTFADCVPLLFHDPVREVVGAAHAGWRGTAAGIARHTIAAMCDAFGCRPADIRGAIGPSIGPCCYTVGSDVCTEFRARGNPPIMRGHHLDLWAGNEVQMRDAGVTLVETAGLCTACHTDLFFSHRAESGRTGRFALVAGLRA